MAGEYVPVDLAEYANATVADYLDLARQTTGSYLEERADPPTGDLTFRGVPFLVPEGAGRPSFVAPGRTHDRSVVVPIGRPAQTIGFAHVLLDSDAWTAPSVARRIAVYRMTYADGAVLDVPIRERLEIGNIPLPWGQYPMLAVPDRHDAMEDQYEGQFARAGFRQTEIQPSSPAAYFLWFWRNPQPAAAIDTVTMLSDRPGLLIAGMTLGLVDEDPVGFRARRTARVRVDSPDAALGDASPIRVGVDRGVVSYPQPLPGTALDREPDVHPGWGALPDAGGGRYVHIAAAPSATVSVTAGGTLAGAVRWEQVQRGGAQRDARTTVELLDPGRNWVRVRVTDADSGELVPCRIAFQTPDGVPYAPHGHHAPIYADLPNWNVDIGGDVRIGRVGYAYIDGTCEGWLPRGELIVDIARGFEYEPVRLRTSIAEDQQVLHLQLRRWVDMNAHGWFSGDTHVHFLSSQGALREAAGEDLNVVNLLQTQWGHLFTSTEEFTGRALRSRDGRHEVWVSQENREHLLGHLGLLGLKAPVMPWATGGPGEGELGGALETTLARWADEAHEKGGMVVLAHFPTPNGEAPVLVATGRADAVEMYDQLAYEHLEYYRYLNDGYRLPLVAGTDKMSSGVPVGMYRTYVQLREGERFSFRAWSRGIRAGRTFITSGPILRMTVNGHAIGSTLNVPPGTVVEVECEASSTLPIQSLQLVERGRVIDAVERTRPDRAMKLASRVTITGPTWLAARCGGPGYAPLRHFDEQQRGIMAHTSPVYIAVGPRYDLRDAEVSEYMLTLVGAAREYLHASAQYEPGSATHRHGRADHMAYLDEPFVEAEHRIRARRRARGHAR